MMPAADSQCARYRRVQLDKRRVNRGSGRAGQRSVPLCHRGMAEDSMQAEQPFFTGEEKEGREEEGGRGVELVPNVWWQAVARKSES